MPQLPDDLPGVTSLLAFRPEVAAPMRQLAETLLLGDNTLSSAERETIATFVSTLNDCTFCRNSHRAAAAHNEVSSYEFGNAACSGLENAPVSGKLKALLEVAEKVQHGGKHVLAADIAKAQAGRFGNAGRDIARGPAFTDVEASLARASRLRETTSLEFHAESFNVANHTNLGFPVADLNSPNFGQILSAGSPRLMQFALKLIF